MIKTFKEQKGSLVTGFVMILILSLLTLRALSFLNQGDHKQGVNSHIPPDGQGLYESCAPRDSTNCFDRLKQMAEAGFTLVLNYDQLSGTAEQQLAYAEQAHSLGMKVIWAMHNPVFWNGTDLVSFYSDLAATCKCSDNNGFIHYVVSLVKDLPATWGYYIGDEVSPDKHAKLMAYTDLIHQLDPNHPRLIILGSNAPFVTPDLSAFADTAEVLGQDYYPIGAEFEGLGSYTQAGVVAHSVQAVVDQANRQSAMVLQSFSWTSYYPPARCSPYPDCAPFPTKDQMQQMLSLTLQNSHPRLILWYSYFDILSSDNPSGHWKDLFEAASADQ